MNCLVHSHCSLPCACTSPRLLRLFAAFPVCALAERWCSPPCMCNSCCQGPPGLNLWHALCCAKHVGSLPRIKCGTASFCSPGRLGTACAMAMWHTHVQWLVHKHICSVAVPPHCGQSQLSMHVPLFRPCLSAYKAPHPRTSSLPFHVSSIPSLLPPPGGL